MKGRFGHLPPTQWTVRLYWGFLSCPRAVTQAITKPYHVTWWGFADDSTGVGWLQFLMEYICLLNHLPAGCAVISLLPTLWAACVRQGEERRHLEVLFADNKGMEREDKTLNFFFPFFFPALAVRPHTTWFCHWDMELHFSQSIFSCSPAVTDTTTDLDVALSFCTRYQYWALGQDFQSQLMIMSVLIW